MFFKIFFLDIRFYCCVGKFDQPFNLSSSSSVSSSARFIPMAWCVAELGWKSSNNWNFVASPVLRNFRAGRSPRLKDCSASQTQCFLGLCHLWQLVSKLDPSWSKKNDSLVVKKCKEDRNCQTHLLKPLILHRTKEQFQNREILHISMGSKDSNYLLLHISLVQGEYMGISYHFESFWCSALTNPFQKGELAHHHVWKTYDLHTSASHTVAVACDNRS